MEQKPPNEEEIRAQLEAMFNEHHDRLLRMIEVRLTPDLRRAVEPEDVLQEAFIEAFRQLRTAVSKPKGEPIVWLRLIVGQQLIAIHRRYLKTQKRNRANERSFNAFRSVRADSASMSGFLIGKLSSPSTAARRQELIEKLRTCLDLLDEEDREVISLRHFEQLTNVETAQELEIPPAAASSRYLKALKRFREILCENRLDELLE